MLFVHATGWLMVTLYLLGCSAADQTAASLRKAGDNAVLAGKLTEATELYSKVIALEPTAQSYYKRATIAVRRKKYEKAIPDLEKALELDPTFTKPLSHLARSKMAVGDCSAAVKGFEAILKTKPTDKTSLKRLAEAKDCVKHLNNADHFAKSNKQQEKVALDAALAYAPNCLDLIKRRSKVLFALKQYHDVLSDTRTLLNANKQDLDALAIRGQAYYYLADHDTAINHYKQGLRSDPDHKELKTLYKALQKYLRQLKRADEDLNNRDYKSAADTYMALIQQDPGHVNFNGQLYFKSCGALIKAKDVSTAVAHCSKALEFEQNNIDFWMKRAEAYLEAEDYDKAIADYKKATEIDRNNRAAKEGLQFAEKQKKMAGRKNYYKILGVDKSATKSEIKKQFRKMALQYHPDKAQGEEAKEEAEAKFKEIGEAYEILWDEEKRAKYDRGEDINPPPGQRGGGFPQGFNPFGGRPGGGGFKFKFG